MSINSQDLMAQIQSGNLDLATLEKMSTESAQPADVTGWEVVYSSSTGQLSAYCTVTANNSGDTLTGIGLVVYNGSGTQMYCLQYSNGIDDLEINTSVGTTLYNTGMGNTALSIVYGFTQNSGMYYFSDVLTIGSV